MELKNTIRVERAKLDISQKELAKAVNLAPQTISNAENGADIMLSTAWKIARYFGLNVEDIFTLEGGKDE